MGHEAAQASYQDAPETVSASPRLSAFTQVRIATREDAPEILRLLHVMHSESGLMPLDERCAAEFFERAFAKKGGIIGVIGEPNNIEAMQYLLVSKFWYSKDHHLEECFNFVRHDMRKSDHARKLLSFAKECADTLKIPLVIGVLTNSRMEGKVRLYRRSLGIPAGAFFVYNANWTMPEPSSEDFWRAPFHEQRVKRKRD